jgi:hypothetical protein
MLTLKEILDRAYIGMMKQGEISYYNGGCVYETTNENRILRCGWGFVLGEFAKDCPAGNLGKNPSEAVNKYSLAVLGPMEEGWVELGRDIQKCHDDFSVERWKDRLTEIYNKLNLSIPDIDEE